MKISRKDQKRIVILITATSLLLSVSFAGLSINPTTESQISGFIGSNPILARSLIIILNALTIIIWPFSMALINLVAIKYIPWGEVAIYSILGNIVGYIWAYWIAKKYKNYFKGLFSTFKKVDQFEEELNGNERFGGLILLRIAFQGFSDYTSYLLGILDIDFKLFLITTIIAEILIKVPRYYLVYLGINVNPLYFIGIAALIIGGYLLYKYKNINKEPSS